MGQLGRWKPQPSGTRTPYARQARRQQRQQTDISILGSLRDMQPHTALGIAPDGQVAMTICSLFVFLVPTQMQRSGRRDHMYTSSTQTLQACMATQLNC